MRLSTAIRIGSLTTKQITGTAADNEGGYCALGAALNAVNIEPGFYTWGDQIRDAFPISMTQVVHPLSGDPEPKYLMDVIWSLNYYWEWTREAIADFVERIEIKEEASFLTTRETVLHE
jgi:hypothetical protein